MYVFTLFYSYNYTLCYFKYLFFKFLLIGEIDYFKNYVFLILKTIW